MFFLPDLRHGSDQAEVRFVPHQSGDPQLPGRLLLNRKKGSATSDLATSDGPAAEPDVNQPQGQDHRPLRVVG